MKAMTENDICFATTKCAKAFNTDGVERTELNPIEVRKALDFTIVKKQSFDEAGREIPNQYHLVREDTNQFIPSIGVGEKFTPVQHLSVYDYIINEIMPKVPEMHLEAVGTLHGCGTGLVMANIGGAFSVPGDESPNNTRVMFSNPCNGLGSLLLGFTTVRLFCQNQIPVACRQTKQDGFQIRHTKNAELYVGDALRVIYASIEKAIEIRKMSENLAKVKINRAFIDKVMDEIYPFQFTEEDSKRGYTINEKRREEVIEEFESGHTAETINGDTAWKVFNAFTYPIYNPKKFGKNTDAAQVAYTGAVGQRADKVSRIFNIIHNASMRYAA